MSCVSLISFLKQVLFKRQKEIVNNKIIHELTLHTSNCLFSS